jgi:MFS family permease
MCFMIMLDSNIVAVSLPSIARDPGAAFSDIEWVVSAYVLTFAALLMRGTDRRPGDCCAW